MNNAAPGLPEFDYIKPHSLTQASEFLAEHAGEARPFLGGTDVFVRLRDGAWKDKYLIDVKHLDGSDQLAFDPQAGLTIGAAVNMNRVIAAPPIQENYPVLVEACRSVASYQLRTRATIVGNLCNASPAGDTIGACLLLDGRLRVHGLDGFRWEPLKDFFLGPGQTRLQPGDVVTALHFPLPPPFCSGTYVKLGRNDLSDLAIVGVTVLTHPAAILPSGYRFRIALAAVAPVPLLALEAEAYLAEKRPSEAAFKEAAHLAQAACHPIDDLRGSARYRLAMVRNLTLQALRTTWNARADSPARADPPA